MPSLVERLNNDRKNLLQLDGTNPLLNFKAFKAKGIEFVRQPTKEEYGTVAVFKDLYGNLWDLIGKDA